jgi:hypothetical protein
VGDNELTVLKKNYMCSEEVGYEVAAAAIVRQPATRCLEVPVKVEFLFDFASPNAYLAERLIPDIERRTGVKFAYVPVLLGGLTNNRSTVESLAGIKNKPQFMELETERFIHRHNISTFRKNPFFPVNTLQLMRGLRTLAQATVRELWPKNIHVAHLVIDAGVNTAWVRERIKEREGQGRARQPRPQPADAPGSRCRGLLATLSAASQRVGVRAGDSSIRREMVTWGVGAHRWSGAWK